MVSPILTTQTVITYTFTNTTNPVLLGNFLTNAPLASGVIVEGFWDFNGYFSTENQTNPFIYAFLIVDVVQSDGVTVVHNLHTGTHFTGVDVNTGTVVLTLFMIQFYVNPYTITDLSNRIRIQVYVQSPSGNPNNKFVNMGFREGAQSHIHTTLIANMATGPTGPTGPTGANGVNGAQIVYSSSSLYNVPSNADNSQLIVINDVAPITPDYYSLGANGAQNDVNAMDTDGTSLYVGGLFNAVNGTATGFVAKLNQSGTVTDTLNGGFQSGPVNAIQVTTNRVYAGGNLTFTPQGTPMNNVAFYSGNTWFNMGAGTAGLSNVVNTVYKGTNEVFVGGQFTTDSNGNSMPYLTSYHEANNVFNPVQDPAITPFGVNGSVYAVETDGTFIYVGGSFSMAGEIQSTNVAAYNISSKTWSALTGQINNSGSYTTVQNGEGTNDTVRALYWDTSTSRLYVGGDFVRVQSGQISAFRIAYWTPGTWSVLTDLSGNNGMNNPVYCITGNGTGIYAGGNFTATMGGMNASYVAYWTQTDWIPLNAPSNPPNQTYDGVGGPVYCLWHGTSPQFSGGNGLVVGGQFVHVASLTGMDQLANHVAIWIPQNNYWCSIFADFNNNPPLTLPGVQGGSVHGITCAYDGVNTNLYIGGDFSSVQDSNSTWTYPYIVQYTLTNSGPTYFNGGWNNALTSLDNEVRTLHYVSPNLYAGGSFSFAGSIQVSRTALWDGSNWYPTPYLPSIGTGAGVHGGGSIVRSIKYDPLNQFILNGGTFIHANEVRSTLNASNVAYYHVPNYTWHPLRESVPPYGIKEVAVPSGKVYAIATDYNSKIYVGGDFVNAGGIYANNIAVYDISNNEWSGLVDSNTHVNGVDGPVYALYYYNYLFVGGDFLNAGGQSANYIAGWSYTNNTWNTLHTGTDNIVRAITFDNSSLFVGGDFINAGGTQVNYIATWNFTSWGALTDTFGATGTNGPVYALAYGSSLSNGPIVVGGSFSVAGGSNASNVALWNYSYFSSLSTIFAGEGTNGSVYALAVGGWNIQPLTQTVIYVGGDFTSVGNSVSASYLAAYNTNNASWNVLGNNGVSTLDAPVRSLNYPGTNFDTRLFIGGDFTQVGVLDYHALYSGLLTDVNGVMLFQESQTLSSSWFDTLPNQSSSSTLYATNISGVQKSGSDGVYAVLYMPNTNRLNVGGNFKACYHASGTMNARNVAIMTLGGSWNKMASPIPALDGPVNTIVQISNRIYTGGAFTGLLTGNQILNNLAYWDTTTYLWRSVGNGVSAYVSALEYATSSSLYVGGAFITGGNTTLNRIGLLDTSTDTWTQLVGLSNVGFNGVVRSLNYVSGTVYVTGTFSATSSSSINLGRVAKLNTSNQIEQIANVSLSHVGMNGNVYATLFISPRVYFGGSFIQTVPTSNLPLQHLSYFITTNLLTPLIVTTSTLGFLNTEDGTTYTSISIPTRYKNIYLMYNASLQQWLLTYRSTGVTLS